MHFAAWGGRTTPPRFPVQRCPNTINCQYLLQSLEGQATDSIIGFESHQGKELFLHHHVYIGVHSTSYPMGTVPFARVKAAGAWR